MGKENTILIFFLKYVFQENCFNYHRDIRSDFVLKTATAQQWPTSWNVAHIKAGPPQVCSQQSCQRDVSLLVNGADFLSEKHAGFLITIRVLKVM